MGDGVHVGTGAALETVVAVPVAHRQEGAVVGADFGQVSLVSNVGGEECLEPAKALELGSGVRGQGLWSMDVWMGYEYESGPLQVSIVEIAVQKGPFESTRKNLGHGWLAWHSLLLRM